PQRRWWPRSRRPGSPSAAPPARTIGYRIRVWRTGRRRATSDGPPPDTEGPPLMPQLLRLATAGSVDDGKSTLIGRLLFDAHALFDDQVEAIQRTSQRFGRVGL